MDSIRSQMFKFNLESHNLREAFCGYFNACLFSDCTIVSKCGKFLNVHRVVLSASSDYLAKLFLVRNSDANIVVAFPSLTFDDLENVMKFIYVGELTIDEKSLDGFMLTAETLQIKGVKAGEPLAAVEAENINKDASSSTLNTSSSSSSSASSKSSNNTIATAARANPKANQRQTPPRRRNVRRLPKPLKTSKSPTQKNRLLPSTESPNEQHLQPSTSNQIAQPSVDQHLAKPVPVGKLRMRSKSLANPMEIKTSPEPVSSIQQAKKRNSRRKSIDVVDQRWSVVGTAVGGKSFQCNLCQKLFSTERNVYRHHAICLFNPNKPKFQCKFCPKTLTSRYRLNTHEKTHVTTETPQASQE